MKRIGKITLGGLLCALASVAMLLTVFQATVYALPALAGVILLPMALENGTKWGLTTFAVTALIALLLVPQWEAKLLFIGFFGYYPILKPLLERLPKRWLQLGAKLLLFNGAMIGIYALLFGLFHMDAAEFELFGVNFIWGFLALGNVIFFVFDYALVGIVRLYQVRLHPVITKLFRYH